MENFQHHKLHALFLLLLQFHSLAYTVPDKFFINCGSDSNVTDSSSGRIFIGEREGEMESSSSVLPFIFPKHGSSKEKENNHSPTPTPTPPLYQTARLFHAESEYKFRIENHGYHLLRLHFFAFEGNLSSAHFNVSVPGFCLLNNFTPQNNNKPLIEEFFLIINTNNFQITFSPIPPNLAFINAIELFLLPNTFIPKVRKFYDYNRTGPGQNSPHKYAYLNGLELMEIVEKTSSSPMVKEEQQSHHSHSHSHWHCPWHMCGNLKLLAIVGAVALVSVIAVVLFLVCLKLKKMKHDESVNWLPMEKKGGGSSHSHTRYGSSHGSSSSSYSHVPNLNKISFDELQVATNNFDQNWVIGKGNFGTVYKGLLNNGMRVAVKRLLQQQGLLDMEEEIKILLRIRHRHLVSLMGYCYERPEMILVYEYMEKGTLKDHIYNSNLCWIQRLEICIGAARGLNYLHNGSSCRGINNVHSHVKSSNILLDENNMAKISGFGLSRKLGGSDEKKMRCDDVYSLGVVLVEVVCGRVGEWGSIWKKKGRLEEIVDPCIKGEIDGKSLTKFGETVDKCLRKKGLERPCMSDVLWDLEYALQLQRGAIQTITHSHGNDNAAAIKNTTQEMAILKHDQLNSAVNYYS
ncbi:hypothetical protein PIB30_044668 [Stylosanthes scabra]|uniref:Protein kinase domain-containing protein n=1 Tax=Stylosanthes scabra TaxID=79078 RepID=A0ABU6ZEP5_9FABA|nr:hypothetical protein [Stylosanthes scabra]